MLFQNGVYCTGGHLAQCEFINPDGSKSWGWRFIGAGIDDEVFFDGRSLRDDEFAETAETKEGLLTLRTLPSLACLEGLTNLDPRFAEKERWLIAYSKTSDSPLYVESNYETLAGLFDGNGCKDAVCEYIATHFGAGNVFYLLIDSLHAAANDALQIALDALERLEDGQNELDSEACSKLRVERVKEIWESMSDVEKLETYDKAAKSFADVERDWEFLTDGLTAQVYEYLCDCYEL